MCGSNTVKNYTYERADDLYSDLQDHNAIVTNNRMHLCIERCELKLVMRTNRHMREESHMAERLRPKGSTTRIGNRRTEVNREWKRREFLRRVYTHG